jgi:hypothetical protein
VLCPDANLSLRTKSLSQMHAELQGFMATAGVVAAAAPGPIKWPSDARAIQSHP